MFETSETIGSLADALAKVQGSIETVKKTKKAEGKKFSYNYADIASVIEAVQIPLAQNSLALVQTPLDIRRIDGSRPEYVVTVVTELMHASGEWIRFSTDMLCEREGAQGIGSAITYARRYALSALLMIPQEDDDGEKATYDGHTTAEMIGILSQHGISADDFANTVYGKPLNSLTRAEINSICERPTDGINFYLKKVDSGKSVFSTVTGGR